MLGKIKKSLVVGSAVVAAICFAAGTGIAADKTKLRIQTHYAPEQLSGKLATEFVERIQTMSG